MEASSGQPARPSRRALLRYLCEGLALPLCGGAYAREFEPYWPVFHELAIAVKGLPAAMEGARITQLTDLHVGHSVPEKYVRGVVEQVNALRPDAVFVTGDLVTRPNGWIREACEVVARLRAPTFVSLGNHDYGRLTYEGRDVEMSDEIERRLTALGVRVLRNRAVEWEGMWIVGLEDLSSGQFSPAQALAHLDLSKPTLALSHNPDTAASLDGYGVGWIFSGHTHGGQIVLPGVGPLMLPIQNRQWASGLFRLGHSNLYVSRGIGFLARVRLFCRPEVVTFRLTRQG